MKYTWVSFQKVTPKEICNQYKLINTATGDYDFHVLILYITWYFPNKLLAVSCHLALCN